MPCAPTCPFAACVPVGAYAPAPRQGARVHRDADGPAPRRARHMLLPCTVVNSLRRFTFTRSPVPQCHTAVSLCAHMPHVHVSAHVEGRFHVLFHMWRFCRVAGAGGEEGRPAVFRVLKNPNWPMLASCSLSELSLEERSPSTFNAFAAAANISLRLHSDVRCPVKLHFEHFEEKAGHSSFLTRLEALYPCPHWPQ